jgi:hypothetical protein
VVHQDAYAAAIPESNTGSEAGSVQ